MAGRAEEACDGESCAKDIERGGYRKRRDASKHQESGENYNQYALSCKVLYAQKYDCRQNIRSRVSKMRPRGSKAADFAVNQKHVGRA